MSLDIEKICRTCLALSGPLLSIFDGASGGGDSCVADMLKDLTKLKPKHGDKMPEKICLTCISEINRCYSFKKKCENSNKTLYQLIPEAIEEEEGEEAISDVKRRNVRLSTKAVQTTLEKCKKFVTAQAQTIAEENVKVYHQSVQTEPNNSDRATSPRSEKFFKQELGLQVKNAQGDFQQEHLEQFVINPKRRITRSIANAAKATDPEKVIAYKRLNLDIEDQSVDQVIYELESENDPNYTGGDEHDDTEIQEYAEGGNEVAHTAYYVISDSQAGEDSPNIDVAYDSDNYDETRYNENEILQNQQQQQQIARENFNFTIVNTEEEGEEEIAHVAATSGSFTHEEFSKPEAASIKKCAFKCPECPVDFVSVKNLKRHCMKVHIWSLNEVNALEALEGEKTTGKKSGKRKLLIKCEEDIRDIDLPPEVESAIMEKLEVERSNQQPKKERSPFVTPGGCSVADAPPKDMKYFCSLCNAGFALSKSLSIHMKQNQCTLKSFECPECKRVFSSEESLEEHQKTHVLAFKCTECNVVFDDNGELSQHLINAHNRNPKNQCGICKKVFKRKFTLKRHLNLHAGDKPFNCSNRNPKNQCGICKKVFTNRFNLKEHLSMHTGEKPFPCSMCGITFRRRRVFHEHIQRHLKREGFQCKECPLKFVSNKALIAHIRTHLGGKPFKCEICNKRYYTNSVLNRHKLIHTGEVPYACDLCPKRFSLSTRLREHRRRHTGEKPHECIYCKKSFVTRRECQIHQRKHTGEKPFVCHCKATFRDLSNLRKHTKIHEREQSNMANIGKKCKRKSAIKSDYVSPLEIKVPKIVEVLSLHDQNESVEIELGDVADSQEEFIKIEISDKSIV